MLKLLVMRPQPFARYPNVVAGFSRRGGGVSAPPFESLNLSVSVGDLASNVKENRDRLFSAYGIDPSSLAIGGLVHGNNVCRADKPGLFKETDGLVTDRAGLALVVTAADCAVLLSVDQQTGIIGVCHAGWRGAVSMIVTETINKMVSMGASAGDISSYISPCISVDKFEVGIDVASEFDQSHVQLRDGRYYVDLKSHLRSELETCGVAEVDVDPACTMTEQDTYFSFRREGKTGRMMGFIMRRCDP